MARYNVSNCLAAIAVGYLHGIAPEMIARALATFPGVPGRMERIEAGQPFTVVVDYAHTADSLEKVLRVLRPLTAGRLIVVFGSAGERDRVKRPEMGEVAARLADFAVITDEDPREEDAMTILREIAAGADAAGAREGEQFVCVVDGARVFVWRWRWRARAMWSCWRGRDTSRASSSARRSCPGTILPSRVRRSRRSATLA